MKQYEELKKKFEAQQKEITELKEIVSKVFKNEEGPSPYSAGALKFMTDLGLYQGNTEGNLLAKSAITRQDFAVSLKRYHDKLHK